MNAFFQSYVMSDSDREAIDLANDGKPELLTRRLVGIHKAIASLLTPSPVHHHRSATGLLNYNRQLMRALIEEVSNERVRKALSELFLGDD